MICIASSTVPDRHPRLWLHTTLPRLSLCFSFSHSYVHACTRVRTAHTFACAPFFSPSVHTNSRILSFTIHPRALFSLYGDVVRNTYVTPKLIRYNFTGRLRSSIYSLLLRRRAVGLPVGLSVLPLPRLPTSQRRYPLPVIGFPRFSQLFLKSRATLFFPVLAPLSFDRVARSRVLPRGTIGQRMRDGSAVDSLSSDAAIALFRCEGSLERLKKLNCAFIVDYLGSCLNVSRKQPARLLEYSVTSTTIYLYKDLFE